MHSYDSVDQYLKTLPLNVREILEKIRKMVKHLATEAEEGISYGMPGYKLGGRALIYFAGWKNHIAIYPVPSGIEAFKDELKPYIAGKGTLKFPLDKEIPYDLIEKVIKFRVEENLEKSKK